MLKGLEKWGKRGLARIIKSFLPAQSSSGTSPEVSAVRRILVIRHDNKLGNLLLITPFLHSLRRALPDAGITLLVSEAFPGVFEGNDDIDRILLYHKANLKKYPWRALCFLRELREVHCDLAVDLSHPHSFSLTSAILAFLSGAPLRLGFERGDAAHYLNLTIPMSAEKQHESDIFLGLLRHLDLGASPGPLRYEVRAAESAWAREEFERLGWRRTEPLIGMFTGGRGRKKIEIDKLVETAEMISSQQLGQVVFFTGPLEHDTRNHLVKMSHGDWIVPPELPLRNFAALLSLVSVLVTPDSGPMHLASGIGIPVVAVFREDTSWRYGPRAKHDTTLFFTGEVDCTEIYRAVTKVQGKRVGSNTDKHLYGSETQNS